MAPAIEMSYNQSRSLKDKRLRFLSYVIKAASAISLLSKCEDILLCVIWKIKEVQKTVTKTRVLGKMKGERAAKCGFIISNN